MYMYVFIQFLHAWRTYVSTDGKNNFYLETTYRFEWSESLAIVTGVIVIIVLVGVIVVIDYY